MDMSDETQGKNCLFPLIIFVSSIIGLGVMILLLRALTIKLPLPY